MWNNNIIKTFKFIPAVISLASPIVFIRIFYMVINIIGMIVIAKFGQQQLAAGALITVVLNTTIVIGMSPFLAIGIVVSKAYGENDKHKIGRIINLGLYLAFFISLLIILILFKLTFILQFFKQPAALILFVSAYTKIYAYGVVPYLFISALYQLYLATKRQQLVMLWSILLFLFTVPLGLFFSYGTMGFPDKGMYGWAYGTVISNWLLLIIVTLSIWLNKEYRTYGIFKRWKLNLNELKEIYQMCLPITMQFASELLAFALLNLMIGWLGTDVLGAQQIIIQCMTITLMIPMGIAQAASILISRALGQKMLQDLQLIIKSSLLLTTLCMLLIIFIYVLFPQEIIRLYVKPQHLSVEFISLVTFNLLLAGISQFGDAVRNVFIGCLRGFRDIWQPMYINISVLISALLIVYLYTSLGHAVLTGITCIFMFAYWCGAAFTGRHLYRKHLVKNQLLAAEPSNT